MPPCTHLLGAPVQRHELGALQAVPAVHAQVGCRCPQRLAAEARCLQLARRLQHQRVTQQAVRRGGLCARQPCVVRPGPARVTERLPAGGAAVPVRGLALAPAQRRAAAAAASGGGGDTAAAPAGALLRAAAAVGWQPLYQRFAAGRGAPACMRAWRRAINAASPKQQLPPSRATGKHTRTE
jgi:hypothetical protein